MSNRLDKVRFPALYPSAIERTYARALRDFAREIGTLTLREVTPILPRLTTEAYRHRSDAEGDAPDELNVASYYSALTAALRRVGSLSNQRVTALLAMARRYAGQVNTFNAQQMRKAVEAKFGTDVHAAARWAAKAQAKRSRRAGVASHVSHGPATASGGHGGRKPPGGASFEDMPWNPVHPPPRPRQPGETQAEANARIRSEISVDLFQGEDAWLADELKAFEAENLRLIKSLPEQHINRLQGKIVQALRSGQSTPQLTKIIRENTDVTENRAILIARTEIAKLNGQLSMLRQTSIGIDKFRWSGVLDSRERATHRAREGIIGAWSSGVGGIWPGSEPNCRCIGTPYWGDEALDS